MSDEGFRRAADAYLHEAASTMQATLDRCLDDVVAAADVLTASFRAGGKLLICGNGGSAADAQHLATEFVSTLHDRQPAPVDPGDRADDGYVRAHRDRERLRRRGDVRAAGGIALGARATC